MKYYKLYNDPDAVEEQISYGEAVKALMTTYNYKMFDENIKYKCGIPEMLSEEGTVPYKFGFIICRGEPLRICSGCGKPILQGYLVEGGFHNEYYCSDACLHRAYTDEEYQNLYNEDEAYWTSWIDDYDDGELNDIWGIHTVPVKEESK